MISILIIISFLRMDYKRIFNSDDLDIRMSRFSHLLETSGCNKNPHQFQGLYWCLQNELCTNPVLGIRGGIVADDMGLGKTITMIGLCFARFVRRTLIILPIALVDQWVQQFVRLTGHKPYVCKNKNIDIEALENAHFVITTYSTLTLVTRMKDPKLGISIVPKKLHIHLMKWDRIICDEAHHLRNCKTSRFESIEPIKSRIKWLITGTPVQNSKKDIFNLGLFLGFPSSVCNSPLGINFIVKHFIIRRTKKEVGINIPDLNVINKVVLWKNDCEKNLSEELHSSLKVTGVSSVKSGVVSNHYKGIANILIVLKARQSCIMPSLLSKDFNLMYKRGLFNDNDDKMMMYYEAIRYTSKLDGVLKLISQRANNGNGKIVFCQFRGEIDEIYRRIRSIGLNVEVYDGRLSLNKRNEILKRKLDVLIMQIQTGCEGLNLQDNYNEVYFTTPHWNPCVEDQAIARCHRIGQKKPVYVFKFQMKSFKGKKIIVLNDENEVSDNSINKKNRKTFTLDNYVVKIQDIKRDISSQILNPVDDYDVVKPPICDCSNADISTVSQ